MLKKHHGNLGAEAGKCSFCIRCMLLQNQEQKVDDQGKSNLGLGSILPVPIKFLHPEILLLSLFDRCARIYSVKNLDFLRSIYGQGAYERQQKKKGVSSSYLLYLKYLT